MRQPKNEIKNVLCVYAASQTYTSTVFEHLDAFRKYSKSSWSYVDMSLFNDEEVGIDFYDAIVVHYSVRLPFGQMSDTGIRKLYDFRGLRVLFIQDEYDNTNVVKKIIGAGSFDLVFSVVPDRSMSRIYPSNEFPQTKFVSTLTGYVPDELASQVETLNYPSTRPLFLAYRGRPLPIRYGRLGQEKVAIGQRVKDFCLKHDISCDIEWREQHRIYGKEWYAFIASAKAMLGSESGSNVFDWDGDLQEIIDKYKKTFPYLLKFLGFWWRAKSDSVNSIVNSKESDIYHKIIEKREVDGLMNQLSPRIFEMAAAKTVMVLFEGSYSGVLKPGIHFLPLKKDFSNLHEIIAELKDDKKVDAMADRAYQDIIRSGNYSYKQFVALVDSKMLEMFEVLKVQPVSVEPQPSMRLHKATEMPVRSTFPLPSYLPFHSLYFNRLMHHVINLVYPVVITVWARVPMRFRPFIKRLLGRT